MKIKNILICLSIVLLMSACNSPNTPDIEGGVRGQAENQMVHRQNKNASETKENSFDSATTNYGAIDYHQVSPGNTIGGLNVMGEEFHSFHRPLPTERDDQLVIENIIYDMPGVTPGMVVLIGKRAWVNVSFENDLTEQQETEQIDEIKRRLLEVNPDYDYQIIINNFI